MSLSPHSSVSLWQQEGNAIGKRVLGEAGREMPLEKGVGGGRDKECAAVDGRSEGGWDGKDKAWLWLLDPWCVFKQGSSVPAWGPLSQTGDRRVGAVLSWKGVSAPAPIHSSA